MSEKVQLTVTGMTCGGCENAVKRALQQLPGVHEVSASHLGNEVDVSFDEATVTPQTIRVRIEALGYTVAA
jgi:copper chaperone